MADSLDRIEAQKISGGEIADTVSSQNFRWWKSEKGTVVLEFLNESSLHGLKYIGQPKRHIVERAFWIVAFIVGLSAAGFLIYKMFKRYEGTPVIVSFQSKEQSVDTIPFPAVTFCFTNQFSKDKVEYLNRSREDLREGEPEYEAISEKLKKIDSICGSQKSFFRAHKNNFNRNYLPRTDYYYIKDQTQFQQETIDLLLEFTPSCKDMIPFIILDGSNVNTELQIFNPVITEYGKCCSFNMLPTPLMLKQPSVRNGNEGDIFSNPVLGSKSKQWWNQKAVADWQKWSYEEGFVLSHDRYKSRIDFEHLKLSHPYINQRLGYRFVEPYCNSITTRGTTFMLHNPVDTPRVSHFPSVIGPNQEAFIKIHPDITIADPDIKNLKIEKRQCLFGKEKTLKYFSPYTQENCFEECTANSIERECGCSMFYMPRINETILCDLYSGSTEGNCVRDTLRFRSTQDICSQCLPLCEHIAYNFEMTTANLLIGNNSEEWRYITDPWRDDFRANVSRNLSIAHIFYGSPSTVPKLRKKLFGITDLIASTGGILGLCLGFSALSGAEVLYYVLMRTIWQKLCKRYECCNTKISSEPSTTATMALVNSAKSKYSGKDKTSKLKRTKVVSKSGRKMRCNAFKFKWRCCILAGAAACAFLVYMLLIGNEGSVKVKKLYKIPPESEDDTGRYYAEATFCYVSQFSMEKVLELRRIANSTSDEIDQYSAETNLSIIDAMCKYKDALESSSSGIFPPINPDFANYPVLMDFLNENTISCSQMFPACVYMGMVQENCREIIKSVDTVFGKCCVVRIAPAQPKTSNSSTNVTELFNATLDYIPGDDNNNTIVTSSLFSKADFNSSYFAIRGARLSEEFSTDKQPYHFSMLLNLNEDPYHCQNSTTPTNQIFFNLHSPGEFPQLQDFSPLLAANEEVVITVFPKAVYTDDPKEIINNEDKKCKPYLWFNRNYESFQTTKAALFHGCSREFLSLNCKCALFGYDSFFWKPTEKSTCKTESNSNDTICLRKMNELMGKLKHFCNPFGSDCRGTTYSYTTKTQSIKDVANLWASLRKFGNDTSDTIPWANNNTGIIHFAFNTLGQTLNSTINSTQRQNLIVDGRGRLAMMLIVVGLNVLGVSLIVLPLVWRRIWALIVKRTLYFNGALHAKKPEF